MQMFMLDPFIEVKHSKSIELLNLAIALYSQFEIAAIY